MRESITTRLSVLTDESNQLLLWVLGFAFYGVGDTVTTLLGLQTPGVNEVGPVAVVLLAIGGIPVLIVWKAVVIGGFYGFAKVLPETVRPAVPLGVLTTGVAVTLWNCRVLLA